jgi:hypothetical protein
VKAFQMRAFCASRSSRKRRLSVEIVRHAMFLLSVVATINLIDPTARASEPIVSAETFVDGIRAEIVQCRRKDRILTIIMRLRNTTPQRLDFHPFGDTFDWDKFYFVADKSKYFMLRDAEDKLLARDEANVTLDGGKSWTWWAKYPAPSDEIRRIDFYTPLTLPFEGLPIQD